MQNSAWEMRIMRNWINFLAWTLGVMGVLCFVVGQLVYITTRPLPSDDALFLVVSGTMYAGLACILFWFSTLHRRHDWNRTRVVLMLVLVMLGLALCLILATITTYVALASLLRT
jgi:magnesium-transporting ATPase (P-type)